jgi:2-desacetyl-2-hydroxyethyl bacteriochlorophyllide A dehydrogenase
LQEIRRVIVTENHEVVTERIPAPEPGARDALVRAILSGVCGSDTHAQHGRHPNILLPYAVGHEVVGVVEGVGPEVTDVSPGDRVTIEPTLPCWSCKPCRRGEENLCENLDFFGCGAPQGGMADLFTIPANRLHRVPEDLGDVAASLIEPLSTPVHAARLAGPLHGKTVGVLGAGTIGLLMLAVIRAQGAARVAVCDILENKRALALRMGADAVVDAAAEDVVEQVRDALGESADVVFDCVASQSTVTQAIAMTLKGGTVVIVGVPSGDATVPLHLIQDQQIRIQGSATYLPRDYAAAIELLRSGAVTAEEIVTGQFPLEEAAAAFNASASGQHIKVLVKVSERAPGSPRPPGSAQRN